MRFSELTDRLTLHKQKRQTVANLKDETFEKTTQRIRPTIHSIINAKRPEPIPKTKPII
jgi:hypothetical protein